MYDILYYYVGGTFAGIIGTVVSQPFDTYKVYLQNGKNLNLKNISLKKKILFSYKGSMPCFIGYGIEKSLVFGTYSTIMNTFSLQENNYYHTLFAGIISGCVASLSITPAEQIKIDRQLMHKTTYNFKNLYKGFVYTLFREGIGFGIYFTVYNQISKYFMQCNNNDIFAIKLTKSAFIGGLSAFIAWLPIYPIDVNKTLIQSNNNIKNYFEELRILKFGKKVQRIYKGYSFCMMRAIPFHSTCFVCFEIMKAYK